MTTLTHFIHALPKAELHLHIEGTLEPDMLMRLAEKHGVSLPYQSREDILAAYDFDSLQSFLDIYYLGAGVLRDSEDFHDLMWAYLCRCREEYVVHAEIMFDPQTHTERGIPFEVFMSGFDAAMNKARNEWGQSSALIMCFLRHLDEADAINTLKQAEPYRELIQSVGLDSSEQGHPPSKFNRVFAMAREQGYLPVAHAGEEGPPEYIHEALDLLKVKRIDHGVRCTEDPALVKRLARQGTPLTVCPLSNVRLCVFDNMAQHNLPQLLDAGLTVTVNSDDPAYFGGYLMDNFKALEADLQLNREQALLLVENSFKAAFLPEEIRQAYLKRVSEVAGKF